MMERIEKGEAPEVLKEITSEALQKNAQAFSKEEFEKWTKSVNLSDALSDDDYEKIKLGEELPKNISDKIKEASKNPETGMRILASIDIFWTNHLENLEALMESVRMRAYGQKDPLVEYKRESFDLFQSLISNSNEWVVNNTFQASRINTDKTARIDTDDNPYKSVSNSQHQSAPNESANVGRNDPCPCGAINPETGRVYKYKHCGLINAPYHKSK